MTEVRKRTRASAKRSGARFNKQIADYLAEHVDDRIEVRHTNGSVDRGDLTSIRLSPALRGGRVVGECKDTAKLQIGPHLGQAEIERGNDDAVAAVVIAKRHGIADPGAQVVYMTVRDFCALLTGTRPPL